MRKSSFIGAVLLSGVLVTGSDYINNVDNNDTKIDTKNNKEYVIIDGSKLDNIILESQEEKINVETNYDNKYTLYKGTTVYSDEVKSREITIDKTMVVSLLETHDKQALVMFDNGVCGYVNVNSLIKCIDVNSSDYRDITENNMVILNNITKVYDNNGMYVVSKYQGTKCYAISMNDKYAYVEFEDGFRGYVELSSLMLLSSKVEGFAYVRNTSTIYDDKELSKEKGNIFAGEIVYVSFINGNYACITNNDGESYYMNIADLDSNYIIVNFTDQRMYCFLNYKLAATYGTRSGRNSSPTHTGDFDIDWKAENWEFTTFPGSFAKHWIPINEYGEGIHDLVGDDEANYGNDLYHSSGSHGCIRVPSTASKFVYDNYDVGDMVLVRKK